MASNPFSAFGNTIGGVDAGSIDYAAIMPEVATRLLGKPSFQTKTELRFGKKGSLSIDLANGRYFSHEDDIGGGVLDLIMRERRCDKSGALAWLEESGLKERDRVGSSPLRPVQSASTFYDYVEGGIVQFRVERRGKGQTPPFLQHAPDGKGGFHSAAGCMEGVRRCLYHADRLANAKPDEIIFFCEGEKDADRLISLGLVATTNPGGAGKVDAVRDSIAQHLTGRSVVVLEDNDEAGARHVAKLLDALEGIAGNAAKLKLDGLPDKGDVSDWLDRGGTIADLKDLAETALNGPSETFALADLSLWSVTQATPKTFIMPGLVPADELTLITGAGGANKSTFGQQLATACAAGVPMLGLEVKQCTTLYLTCEDDESRLHWMQEHLCRALNVSLSDLAGRLHLGSLRGRLGNDLATFDAEGRLRPSPTFRLLRDTIRQTGARLVVLDNAAHLFSGNENDRVQVTQFVNLLYSLCRDIGVTICLVAHSNKAGDSYSGSTAWLNAVRSQIVLTRPEDGHDPDERVLTLGKANYARQGEQLRFRWHDFALIRDADLPEDKRAELAEVIKGNVENERFLECLQKCTADRRNVSHINGVNYAPKIFSGMPEAKGLSRTDFARAMERLLHLGKIKLDQELWPGNDRHMRRGISAANGCGNPPQEMAENRAGTPAGTPCGDLREPLSQVIENTAGTHVAGTPPIYNIPGAAFGAAAPDTEWNKNPALGRMRATDKEVDFPEPENGLDQDGDVIGWNEDRRPRF